MIPYFSSLQSDCVNRMVKPTILAVFGDISLAIGTEFKKYLDVVLTTLAQASQARVDSVSLLSHPLTVTLGLREKLCFSCFPPFLEVFFLL